MYVLSLSLSLCQGTLLLGCVTLVMVQLLWASVLLSLQGGCWTTQARDTQGQNTVGQGCGRYVALGMQQVCGFPWLMIGSSEFLLHTPAHSGTFVMVPSCKVGLLNP